MIMIMIIIKNSNIIMIIINTYIIIQTLLRNSHKITPVFLSAKNYSVVSIKR